MGRAIRASFAGCSGSGKSTLALWLSAELGIPLNPVGSRTVAIEMGFANPYDVDAAGKRGEFQERLQARKVEWEMAHESFTTDRTTLDELVYSGLHGEPSMMYADCALDHVVRYTHIFYCPVDVFCNLDGDPKRMTDMDYQREFDCRLRALLCAVENACAFASDKPAMITIQSADLESRKNQIRAALGLPLVVRDETKGSAA